MRKVISEFTHVPYNDVILKRTEKGKPYLVSEKIVTFAAVVWARHTMLPWGRERCMMSPNNDCKGD